MSNIMNSLPYSILQIYINHRNLALHDRGMCSPPYTGYEGLLLILYKFLNVIG